ncbi:hypothetical protein IWX50DRAFT_122663 [Phyllosticta citricarpa]|uniref:Uncharacterized protein n=1 Tax=Phyllosticta citricarpa TaxID=55181 RepID=A0ABR1MK76_9PEZI
MARLPFFSFLVYFLLRLVTLDLSVAQSPTNHDDGGVTASTASRLLPFSGPSAKAVKSLGTAHSSPSNCQVSNAARLLEPPHLADAAIEELRDAVSALQESLALLMSLPASSALAAVVDLDVEDAEDDRETQVMSCTASKCPMEYAMASEEMGCTLELMTTDAAPTTISTDPPKLSEPTPQLLSCPSCSVPMCPPLQSTLLGAAHSWVASIYR